MSLQTTPFIVLDTETTGLDPAQDRVVQLALVGVRGQTVVPLLNQLVNPGRPIPGRATAIHGFTDAMVADAPSLRDIGRDVKCYIRQVPAVVAHNAAFDQASCRTPGSLGCAPSVSRSMCGRTRPITRTRACGRGWGWTWRGMRTTRQETRWSQGTSWSA